MKTLSVATAVLFALAIFPFGALAHMDESRVAGGSPGATMRALEDQALGNELHEEMEGLMEKMLAGSLTDEESSRMLALMDEFPGPGSMMMGRMMGAGAFSNAGAFGMTRSGFDFSPAGMMGSFGGFAFFGWFVMLLLIAFLALGSAYFLKQLQSGK